MRRFAFLTGSIYLVLVIPASAIAEGFLHLYGGGTFTGEDEGRIEVSGAGLAGDVEFDDSVTAGGRVGYWFPSAPWLGLGVDVSYFASDAPEAVELSGTVDGMDFDVRGKVDAHVIPITPMLLMRSKVLSVSSVGFQPYLGVGPGIFLTVVEASADGTIDGESFDTDLFDDVTASVGVDARAGLNLHLTRWLVVFAEYRFTYFEPEASDDVFGIDVDLEADLDSHHALGGIGFLF